MLDKILLRPHASMLSITGTRPLAGIYNYVADEIRVTKQFNGEVVEVSLFLLPRDVTVPINRPNNWTITLLLPIADSTEAQTEATDCDSKISHLNTWATG